MTNTGLSVIVIEHNLEVIKTADWIIDRGIKDVTAVKDNFTGQYLSAPLGLKKPKRKKSA